MLFLLCCVVGFRYMVGCYKVFMADFHESYQFHNIHNNTP